MSAPNSSPGRAEPPQSSSLVSPAATEDPAPLLIHGPSRAQIWMHRLLVLLFVFACAAAGVLLVIVPWLPQWTDNIFLLRYPGLRSVFANGFFRGLCSGLGILDIWIGFSEAVHYHEESPC